MSDPSAIGVMEGAYFVSKSELLDWLANDFKIKLKKIEECGKGVVYLRILDRMFPGRVPMHKVKLNAKQEWECLQNLKILQSVFIDCNIEKHLDLNRLSKCMYLDNLEFLQWIKRFYDRHYTELNGFVHTNPTATQTVAQHHVATSLRGSDSPKHSNISCKPKTSFLEQKTKPKTTKQAHTLNVSSTLPQNLHRLQTTIQKLEEVIASQNKEIALLNEDNLAIEEERQFYFRKLRQLELMSNEPDRKSFTVEEIQTILFTMEDIPDLDEQQNTQQIETSSTGSTVNKTYEPLTTTTNQ